jgi:hypothetical protein
VALAAAGTRRVDGLNGVLDAQSARVVAQLSRGQRSGGAGALLLLQRALRVELARGGEGYQEGAGGERNGPARPRARP